MLEEEDRERFEASCSVGEEGAGRLEDVELLLFLLESFLLFFCFRFSSAPPQPAEEGPGTGDFLGVLLRDLSEPPDSRSVGWRGSPEMIERKKGSEQKLVRLLVSH